MGAGVAGAGIEAGVSRRNACSEAGDSRWLRSLPPYLPSGWGEQQQQGGWWQEGLQTCAIEVCVEGQQQGWRLALVAERQGWASEDMEEPGRVEAA